MDTARGLGLGSAAAAAAGAASAAAGSVVQGAGAVARAGTEALRFAGAVAAGDVHGLRQMQSHEAIVSMGGDEYEVIADNVADLLAILNWYRWEGSAYVRHSFAISIDCSAFVELQHKFPAEYEELCGCLLLSVTDRGFEVGLRGVVPQDYRVQDFVVAINQGIVPKGVALTLGSSVRGAEFSSIEGELNIEPAKEVLVDFIGGECLSSVDLSACLPSSFARFSSLSGDSTLNISGFRGNLTVGGNCEDRYLLSNCEINITGARDMSLCVYEHDSFDMRKSGKPCIGPGVEFIGARSAQLSFLRVGKIEAGVSVDLVCDKINGGVRLWDGVDAGSELRLGSMSRQEGEEMKISLPAGGVKGRLVLEGDYGQGAGAGKSDEEDLSELRGVKFLIDVGGRERPVAARSLGQLVSDEGEIVFGSAPGSATKAARVSGGGDSVMSEVD